MMPSADVRSRRRGGPTVQAWAFPHLIAWVESQCGDASPIRRLPGLDALDRPDARIPEATADAAWRLAESLTRDEAIGVHVAESLPRGGLDLIEYAVRSSASLGSGLERLAHYGCVLSDRVAARIDANDHGLGLIVGDVGGSPLHHARAEFALAMALKLARDVTGFEIVPVQVAFSHDRPNDTAEHRRFFRGPIRFGAGTNTMLLSAADAARTLPGADAALSAIVRRRLDGPLSKAPPADSAPLSARVRPETSSSATWTTSAPFCHVWAFAASRTRTRTFLPPAMSCFAATDPTLPETPASTIICHLPTWRTWT